MRENSMKNADQAQIDLLKLAKADSDFAELLAKPEQRTNLFGPQDSQKAYLLAALAQDSQRPLVLLVADELRARTLEANLKAYVLAPDSVALLRPREMVLSTADAASHEAEHARLGVIQAWLRGEVKVLIVVAAALLQRTLAPGTFIAGMLKIQKGQSYAPLALEKALLKLGYERVKRAESPGEFARRGDILDVISLNTAKQEIVSESTESLSFGYRISFFDEEIDDLRAFDPVNQRSIDGVETAYFAPVRELAPFAYDSMSLADEIEAYGEEALIKFRKQAGSSEALQTLKVSLDKELEELRNGLDCPSLERWMGLIMGEDVYTILDYIDYKNALMAVDEPVQMKHRLDGAQADFQQRFSTLLLKGQTVPLAAEAQIASVDVMKALDSRKQLISLATMRSSGNGFPRATDRSIQGRDAEHFHGQDDKLLAWLRTMAAAGEHIHLLVHSPDRLEGIRAFVAKNGLAVRVIERELKEGFVYPSAKLIVCGAQDLFGIQRKSRKRKENNALRINFFSDLQPGEKVVHESYGIGLYEGITNTNDAAGTRRDYLTVMYANNERLYLPMEQLSLLQKYVGSESKDVKLSRIGGAEWGRQKEKARSSIKKLATDLVKLYSLRKEKKGHAFSPETPWDREFADSFPYEETDDQLRSIREISADMESTRVMDRLLCGDVGFGKTEVAFRAVFKCVQDGMQAAILAPTTVLAQQHYQNFLERIGSFPVRVGHLSRFASAKERAKTVRGLKSGAIDVVIGTHRILSKDVMFKNLGLLVVDEEQRFGVDHKEKLKALTPTVDVLSMSATPIPRTLHMSMSGIRDISVIDEAPEDRRPVQTYVLEFDEALVQDAILREIARDGQVFYLHNNTHTILEKAAQLEQLLPGARILIAHGQMSERELEDVIMNFVEGEADILVCTTIIESGIDMPRVNTLIVEHADRMGLAQLYQLRGRVGRSERQAYAYITYQRDKVLTEIAEKRLATIRDFTELGAGFKIALRDLEVRGAGNLLGAEQHGQLNAIGYDLYTRMLDEEIQLAKAESDTEDGIVPSAVQVKTVECVLELTLDSYISSDYISDDGERMDIYRRIAQINDLEIYRDVVDELLDRYGDPPLSVTTLMDIAYLRARAAGMGFAKISVVKDSAVFTYSTEIRPDMEQLSKLMNLADYKGQLLFNAGTRPYVVYRGIGNDKTTYPAKLKKLFAQLEVVGARGNA